jgi:hypothetical protein
MIALASDWLMVCRASGESVPLSAEMVAVEVTGDGASDLDSEMVSQAAKAVFHYFKHELSRQTVTVGEFAEALDVVLHGVGLKLDASLPQRATMPAPAPESDLSRLACEAGAGGELFFFGQLREQLRKQLRLARPVVEFHGLRAGVLQLAGARRWTPRCRTLAERIVGYMRKCLAAEAGPRECLLVVR